MFCLDKSRQGKFAMSHQVPEIGLIIVFMSSWQLQNSREGLILPIFGGVYHLFEVHKDLHSLMPIPAWLYTFHKPVLAIITWLGNKNWALLDLCFHLRNRAIFAFRVFVTQLVQNRLVREADVMKTLILLARIQIKCQNMCVWMKQW